MKHRRANSGHAKSRLPVVAPILLFVGFGWVVYNQLRVQVFGRDSILGAAKDVKRLFAQQPLPAKRGDIRAADGRLLARSTNKQTFGLSASKVPQNPTMWSRISNITGVSAAELCDVASRGKSATWQVQLTSAQVEQFEITRGDYGADGLWLSPAGAREYPLGEYAAPVIGFLKEQEGFAGIEQSQNDVLRGRNGKLVGMADRTGSFLPWIAAEGSAPPIDGSDIELTIRTDLQIAAMKALKSRCEYHKAAQGASIVMDAETGDVLALATWPTFSPDRREEALASKSAATPQQNPALARRFEPGSTFKTFTITYGLENGIIKPNEAVYCAGSQAFGGIRMGCSHDHGDKSHGAVTPAKCIEVSCNVAAATWAVRIGFDRYSKMIESLGLLEKQEIGLTPEIRGYLNYDDYNKTIQTANLGFGQALNVTPMGLASAFTVFANDGMRVHPRLIKSIRGVAQPMKRAEPVFRPETARKMLAMMERVVEGDGGTGKALRIPGVKLAGKTGTAQKLGSSKQAGRHYVSSFVGYVPARNPKFLVLVMVDDPHQNGYYGAVVAGPVFKETAKALLKSFRLAPASPGALLAVR